MSWGLNNRLARIIKNGKVVMLAVDHGYFQGPTTGLENPKQLLRSLIPNSDALMITRGLLRTTINSQSNIPIVLRVSGGTSILKELSNEEITTSIEEAIRLNASAITSSIFVGGEYEKQSLVNLSKIVNEGERYGIPVLAVTAVGKDMNRDARYLGLACRIAAELGAHVVKTYYCENFEQLVKGCPIPIVIAGGKKIPERDALQLAYNSIKSGAIGVDMGRNIFQSENPIAMIKAVRGVIHNNFSVSQAYELYEKLSANKAANTNQ